MYGVPDSSEEVLVESARPIYLAELGRCQPAEALSYTPRRGHWRMLDYQTETFRGTMLVAGEETAAPEVTYPLDVRGWYAISIGMLQEGSDGSAPMQAALFLDVDVSGNTFVQVKLSRDPAFTVLTLKKSMTRQFEEVFWKEADLTGQQISFKQLIGPVGPDGRLRGYPGMKARVAYIKLVPLLEPKVQALLADRKKAEKRRLFAHNDAGSTVHWVYGSATPQEIWREVELYRNTDFSRMYWEAAMGDLVNYPSKIGRRLMGNEVEDFVYVGGRVNAEAQRKMSDNGIDPLALALELTHAIGMEFHACCRTAGFYFPPPDDHFNTCGFYGRHPELRAIGRDGQPLPRLSYTFPETRRFVLSLLRELAQQYSIDGVCLLYIRRPPLVGYEPSLIEGFMAEYGEDPRQLDPQDRRWLAYRCRVQTQFMREVRQEMDAVAREQGRAGRLEVTAIVSGREDENFFYGMNVKEWIDLGLVDTIIPYTMAPDLDSAAVSFTDTHDAEYWVNLTQGTACKLAMSVLPRWMPPEEYRRMAAWLYRAGAQNLFFWDCDQRINGDSRAWNAVRRLGHREEIEAWMAAGQPRIQPETLMPTRVGDWTMASGYQDAPA